MKLSSCVAAAIVLSSAVAAAAIDNIVKIGNSRVPGDIKSITAAEVTIDRQGTLEKVPVTEIESILFQGEPSEMNLVRSALRAGREQGAIDQLKSIKPETLTRKEVKQDYDFYAAYSQARLALRGGGVSITAAGGAMFTFYNANKDSYHYYKAVETMGDLLTADGKSDEALKFYTELESAPSDALKMRAGLAAGRSLAAKAEKQADPAAKKAGYDLARQSYEKVLAIPVDASKQGAAQTLRYAATLGRAQCQAAAGEYDAAIKELQDNVIAGLNAEETELQAMAYVTLGNCYKSKPASEKLALLAFLHVDMLYSNAAEPHAEALWNMAKLFRDIKQDERGSECEQKLNRLYPTSPWKSKPRA